jgi:hypothetical protein
LQAVARERLAHIREEMAVREATAKELRRAIRLAGMGLIFSAGEVYGRGHRLLLIGRQHRRRYKGVVYIGWNVLKICPSSWQILQVPRKFISIL